VKNTSNKTIETTLRIPGNWAHPGELLERMPAGFRLGPESLAMPDGTRIEFNPLPPDGQFAAIFASSCRRPATAEEIEIANSYTVNVGLSGPGGSLESASKMMQAGAAIVQAGGAGVFIDNSGLSHGGGAWLELAEDGSPDALSFGYVGIVGNQVQLWTMGMNVLGRPDVLMNRVDDRTQQEFDEGTIIEIIRYLSATEREFADGHIIADENGPRYQAMKGEPDQFPPESPMHNPWGRLKLKSMKEIAENN
jgi:hypothetical protein